MSSAAAIHGPSPGPTLAAEHLAQDHGLEVDAETLRRWMLEAGLWSRERKGRGHRQRRERKAHFGERVQLDGSFHDWLEGRGPRGCLMNMVDDATGTTLSWMGKEETTWAAVGVLRAWIERYEVPQALYTDGKNVYVREPNAQEKLRGEEAVTQFGRMWQELGIEILAASSPQAKGRVERNHGTQQDRLVKKLRRKQINGLEGADGCPKRSALAGLAGLRSSRGPPRDHHGTETKRERKTHESVTTKRGHFYSVKDGDISNQA